MWHRIDFEESRFRDRKCVRSANNVELDRDARAPLLAFSNSLSLSQIQFQLSGDHFHFFSNLLSLVRNSFSQTGHIIWGGEEQILLAIQLICSSCHLSTWPEPKTFFNSSLDLQYQPKMHVQTDLMKCVWYLGVESNFQYHSLTSRESNLWWVWMKTSNWVLFPRSWMALKLCQCKSEMAKTLCIWESHLPHSESNGLVET